MKIVTNAKTLERVGVKSEGEFTIQANAQAFKILSDGLYSDKPKAILRELSCNAYDAHVDSGNMDKPFIVQIPNSLDPTFKIRDFGTGMSPDEMQTVYKTYFMSTKTDSNDKVGCLGLGSKSPFAYTDSFTSTSFFKGTKYIYNCHINEAGTPALALMGQVATDEPNGMEISFTVERTDWRSFSYKVEEVFKYFKLQPTIKGTDVQVKPVEYSVKTSDKWAIRSTMSGSTMAVMGNVAYPIDNMNVSEMTDDERKLLGQYSGLDLFFEIGDLDVQPSREGLQFNKRTIESIRKRLALIIVDVRKNAQVTIKECKTLWEARIKATELNAGGYSRLKFLLEGQGIFTWDGHDLNTSGMIRISDKQTGLFQDSFSVLSFVKRTSYRANLGYSVRKSQVDTLMATEGIKIYFNDIKKGQHIRCKQEAIQEGADGVYLITCTQAVLKQIKARLGLTHIPSISEVEVIKVDSPGRTSVRGTYNPKNAKKILEFETDSSKVSYNSPSSYWKQAEVDLDNGGIWMVIERYKVSSGHFPCRNEHPEEVMAYFNNILNNIGEAPIKVYGIKPSMVEKENIINNKKWITIGEYVKGKLEAYTKNSKRMRTLAEFEIWQDHLKHDYDFKDLIQNMILEKVSGNEDLKKYLSMYAEMQNLEKGDYSIVLSQGKRFDIEIDTSKVKGLRNMSVMVDGIKAHYPLLDCINRNNQNIEAVQQYMNALDLVK